ncbi:MAG TPA: S-methyl-5-thioribose-1-phosphate isomerase [Desulfurococcales archaeon]|nr:S-methyl-5-thioribose-1-phosphate isomerase [Desulfurococcales archaeon]
MHSRFSFNVEVKSYIPYSKHSILGVLFLQLQFKVELKIKPIEWLNGKIKFINVVKLPHKLEYVVTDDLERLAKAIENLEIRGAPAIGVAAALGLAMVAYNSKARSVDSLRDEVEKAANRLRKTRPTAVNLFWAIDRMLRKLREYRGKDVNELKRILVDEALKIMSEDIEANIRMGFIGAELVDDGDTILTHCNTGALATAGFGTALGVIRAAVLQGKRIKVIATETRPLLQGARLTVWELLSEGIPVTLITDSMVGYIMSKGLVDKVFVGADRILLSGHVANKIGTYTIAVLAKEHKIPFYVVAPTSTIDPVSKEIPIEERDPNEVRTVLGEIYITPRNVPVYNPAFDITPPEYITAIITEKGIARPPYEKSLRKLLGLK